MFEIHALAQAWREILRVSEWTGLSLGALAGLAAVFYFDPALRKLAVRGAIAIAVAYVLALYAYHVGGADKQAEWTAANIRVAAEAAGRDLTIGKELEAKYATTPAQDNQANSNEAKILGDISASSAGPCQLGAGALRLRH